MLHDILQSHLVVQFGDERSVWLPVIRFRRANERLVQMVSWGLMGGHLVVGILFRGTRDGLLPASTLMRRGALSEDIEMQDCVGTSSRPARETERGGERELWRANPHNIITDGRSRERA